MTELLKPWLGEAADSADLPLPALIAVEVMRPSARPSCPACSAGWRRPPPGPGWTTTSAP